MKDADKTLVSVEHAQWPGERPTFRKKQPTVHGYVITSVVNGIAVVVGTRRFSLGSKLTQYELEQLKHQESVRLFIE